MKLETIKMDTFLSHIAKDIIGKFGTDLSNIAVVFPNKRAGLFLNELLAKEATTPLWSPVYITISELFEQITHLQRCEPLVAVHELYQCYQQVSKSQETLDQFYFWGELLLSDFDDMDKHLVKAEKLFSHLKEFKRLDDDFSHLDEEQKMALERFFGTFTTEKSTALKEKFLEIWDILGQIYPLFRQTLIQQGIGYEGMLYRDAVERLQNFSFEKKQYLFIGFNVLNDVEKTLFQELQNRGQALFYWDYDIYYTDNQEIGYHEAGEFIKRNLSLFPNALENREALFDSWSQPKEIRIISSSTENGQSKYIPAFLESLSDHHWGKETAIVLCNEELLLPVLSSVDTKIEHINITMGYPLVQTPVFEWISAWLQLQSEGKTESGDYKYEALSRLLRQSLTLQWCPQALEVADQWLAKGQVVVAKERLLSIPTQLQKLLAPCEEVALLARTLPVMIDRIASVYRGEEELSTQLPLHREAIFRAYTICNQLSMLITEREIEITPITLTKLLLRMLSATSIAFHGEPLAGLQIMGVLETRNLDFENLLLLSVNEGKLPKKGNLPSFIPYTLRKGYGLTTPEHQTAVYAYYFYRLMQRAKRISLLYNNTTEGIQKNEMSRFLLQLLAESNHPIEKGIIQNQIVIKNGEPIVIEKTGTHSPIIVQWREHLLSQKGQLSPSALNCFIDCSLRFYFRYILKLEEPTTLSQEVDSAMFGTILHAAAENIYQQIGSDKALVQKCDIEEALKSTVIEEVTDLAFHIHLFQTEEELRGVPPPYNGLQLVTRNVIVRYLKHLLQYDQQYAPFELLGQEKKVKRVVDLKVDGQKEHVIIGGVIDRLDLKNGLLRVIDYKTGQEKNELKTVSDLFVSGEKRSAHVFQTFLYGWMLAPDFRKKYAIAPSLLYIQKCGMENYSCSIYDKSSKTEVADFGSDYEQEFEAELKNLLTGMFSQEVPFSQTENSSTCEYCPYKKVCRR